MDRPRLTQAAAFAPMPGTDVQARPLPSPQPSPGSHPVLVVDDNPDAAEALRIMLELAEFEVEVATDGRGALDAARRHAPDVVLLDINMPGLSGWDVARELRADRRFARTLIIALSGLGMPDDRRRSESAGIDHHFTKPVSLQSLLAAIEDWAQRGGR
jgi:CheY-like chemotaxis protein